MILLKRKYNILIIVFSLVCLNSCDVIYFDSPQPAKSKDLSSVPEIFHGEWSGDDASMHIDAQSFQFQEIKNGNATSVIQYYLSDSLKLRKAKDYYVASIRKEDWWELFILKSTDQNNIHIYYPSIEKVIELKNIEVEEADAKENSATKYYLETQIKSKEVKDIIEEKSLIMILSGDSIIMGRPTTIESKQ